MDYTCETHAPRHPIVEDAAASRQDAIHLPAADARGGRILFANSGGSKDQKNDCVCSRSSVGDLTQRHTSRPLEVAMQRLFMVLLVMLSGCAGSKNDLTFTRASDPVWAVNPSQWLGPAPAQVPSTKGTN